MYKDSYIPEMQDNVNIIMIIKVNLNYCQKHLYLNNKETEEGKRLYREISKYFRMKKTLKKIQCEEGFQQLNLSRKQEKSTPLSISMVYLINRPVSVNVIFNKTV